MTNAGLADLRSHPYEAYASQHAGCQLGPRTFFPAGRARVDQRQAGYGPPGGTGIRHTTAFRLSQWRTNVGEGFGLVLLEAQAAGTPVIATAYGGSHEACIEGVTGVAPADESAEALIRIRGPADASGPGRA